jgi:hypothetical protein
MLIMAAMVTAQANGLLLKVSEAQWQASQNKVGAILSKVPLKHRMRCGRILRGENEQGFAQAWQDWFLYRNFFAGKEDGLYLDIGTNNAITISNTFFFDQCLGWSGICFEMDPQYHNMIRSQRSCLLVPKCVLGTAQTVNYRGTGTTGHIDLSNRRKLQSRSCVGILEEFDRLKLTNRTVDLLSIDIEGAEAEVLRCWPWDKVKVNVILIETNMHNLRGVDNFFHAHGFANVATLPSYNPRLKHWGQLDNVYAFIGKFEYPRGTPTCSTEDRGQNKWCASFNGMISVEKRKWTCS